MCICFYRSTGVSFFFYGKETAFVFVSEFLEGVSGMDFLWQDFIPHIVETFISQGLSNSI
jgi:hypothetical protein